MKKHFEFSLDFKRNPYSGTYIVIEGIDGSGKSTQIERLQKHFEEQGRSVVVTGEPNPTLPTEKLIRDILFGKIQVPSNAFQFLYSADRVLNHETIILPALQRGDIVISHRSFWSAIAHGVIDRGGGEYDHQQTDPIIVAQGILSYYYQFTVADYTFVLDVPAKIAMERIESMHKKADIYERIEKLAKIERGYRWLLRTFPDTITAINGQQPVERISEEILSGIKNTV